MATLKVKKYEYTKVIQQSYGQGWEDNSEYPANSQGNAIDAETKDLIKHDLKEYKLTGYATRLIFRKKLL